MELVIVKFLEAVFWTAIILFAVRVYLIAKNNDAYVEQFGQAREEVKKLIHVVRVEEHHGQYYWFDKKDDSFIAQGKDADEVVEKLKKYYHNHVFILIPDDSGKYSYQLSGPDWVVKTRTLQ